MGCDVHMILQYKQFGNWETFPVPPDFENRCYDCFTMLAGVRHTALVVAIDGPKGLPKDSDFPDINDKNREYGCIEYNGKYLGEHNFSYLTLKEIIQYYNKYLCKRKEKHDPDKSSLENVKFYCTRLIEYMEFFKNGDNNAEDIRIVFGFDS